MMIAVDTNILVNAHRREGPHYEACHRWLTYLAEGSRPWAIPVFCLREFIRVVTHSKVFHPPTSLHVAIDNLKHLSQSPSLQILMPSEAFFSHFWQQLEAADARGNLTFDAQIVALCLEHGVHRILTLDKDFSRFREIDTFDPTQKPSGF